MVNYNRTACSVKQRLSKQSLLAYLTDGSKQKEFLLATPYDSWDVISFDSKTKLVCVKIENGNSIVTLNLTIQTI